MLARNARVSNIRIHLPYLGEVAECLQYLLEGALARAPVRVCQAVDVPLRHELAPNGRNRHDLQRNHLQIGTAVRPMHVKHISSCLFPLPCPLSPYDPLFELEKFQCRNCLQMERGEPFSTQVTTPSEMEYFAMLVCSSLSLPPRQQDVLCLGSGGKKLCSGFSVLCVTVFNGFGLCLRNFQKHHAYESSAGQSLQANLNVALRGTSVCRARRRMCPSLPADHAKPGFKRPIVWLCGGCSGAEVRRGGSRAMPRDCQGCCGPV